MIITNGDAIWANYTDLTVTSLDLWLVRGDYLHMFLFCSFNGFKIWISFHNWGDSLTYNW